MNRLPPKQQTIDKYTKPTTKQGLLDNYPSFQQNDQQESLQTIGIPPELVNFIDTVPLSALDNFFCPFCGSINPEGHIRKDKRDRDHKKETQRWYCKQFNRKFPNDLSPFNYSLWVCYFSCSYLVAGMELEASDILPGINSSSEGVTTK